MNIKAIGIGVGILVTIILFGALGWKIVQKSEGYKANEQNFYTFEPHFFIGGCARYDAFKKPENKNETKLEEKVNNNTNPIGDSGNTLPNGGK